MIDIIQDFVRLFKIVPKYKFLLLFRAGIPDQQAASH